MFGVGTIGWEWHIAAIFWHCRARKVLSGSIMEKNIIEFLDLYLSMVFHTIVSAFSKLKSHATYCMSKSADSLVVNLAIKSRLTMEVSTTF